MTSLLGVPVGLLLAVLQEAPPAPPTAVNVTVALTAQAPWRTTAEGSVRVSVRPQRGNALSGVDGVLSIDGDRLARGQVSVPPGHWIVEVERAGWWVPRTELKVGSEAIEVRLGAWPTARAVFVLDAPGPARMAARVHFRGAPSVPEPSRVPPGVKACDVKGLEVSCEVPASAVDLRVQATERVPSYLWDVTLQPGKPRRFGGPIRRGASLVGYVHDETEAAIPGARVQLQTPDGKPLTPMGLSANRDELGRRPPDLEVETNARGFFQFSGIAPGDYRVVAAAGKPPQVAITAARVEPYREAALSDYLVLQPPSPMELSVDPPVGPGGEPWSVTLVRLSPFQSRTQHPVSVTGWAQIEGVTRGRYVAELLSEGQRWLSKGFSVEGAPEPLRLDVPFVRVKGTVKLKGEALLARLTFGGQAGREHKIDIESDSKGKFEGVLPRAGKWFVFVAAVHPPVQRALRNVEVEAEEGSQEARVDIDLEDGWLRGQLVSEQGEGVKGIVNLMARGEDLNQVFTDDEGSFEVRGLPQGTVVVVEASAYKSKTDALELVLSDAPTDVVLTLRQDKSVEGRVVGAGTGLPVPGVEVIPWPADRPQSLAGKISSDASGRFEFDVPTGTRAVMFLLKGNGIAADIGRAPLVPDQPLTISAVSTGGTLVLEWPPEPEGPKLTAPALLHRGAAFHVRQVAGFMGADRSPFSPPIRLTSLASGDWALCRVAVDVMLQNPTLEFEPTRCVRGVLEAGGELKLSLPAEK